MKKIEACRSAVAAKATITERVSELEHEMEELTSLFNVFKTEARSKSKLFAFCDEYISMVIMLLQFIKAARTRNWFLHLSSVTAMTPYFFAMSRHNYARWLPVYIADMKQLESKHPSIHQEFAAGNHAVNRSRQPFS